MWVFRGMGICSAMGFANVLRLCSALRERVLRLWRPACLSRSC